MTPRLRVYRNLLIFLLLLLLAPWLWPQWALALWMFLGSAGVLAQAYFAYLDTLTPPDRVMERVRRAERLRHTWQVVDRPVVWHIQL